MPQIVRCKHSDCRELLYEGNILKSPQDIIKKYDGNCPNCNRELGVGGANVRIYPNPDEYPHLYGENGNLIESKRNSYRIKYKRNRR